MRRSKRWSLSFFAVTHRHVIRPAADVGKPVVEEFNQGRCGIYVSPRPGPLMTMSRRAAKTRSSTEVVTMADGEQSRRAVEQIDNGGKATALFPSALPAERGARFRGLHAHMSDRVVHPKAIAVPGDRDQRGAKIVKAVVHPLRRLDDASDHLVRTRSPAHAACARPPRAPWREAVVSLRSGSHAPSLSRLRAHPAPRSNNAPLIRRNWRSVRPVMTAMLLLRPSGGTPAGGKARRR
jgi:hypothetical protein